MLSVVIPTLNAEEELPRTLSALVPGAVYGVVKDVVVADGGSADRTSEIVDVAGAHLVPMSAGRGRQLAAGARAARGDWILFLHADTVLEQGWEREVEHFFQQIEAGRFRDPDRVAVFRFALDDFGFWPRFMEKMVSMRCFLFGLPYGDQGLLISRKHYEALGGYKPLPLFEDVDLVRRIGRRRLVFLRSRAVTSPKRYVQSGYLRQVTRNFVCLALYYLWVPPARIARLYDPR